MGLDFRPKNGELIELDPQLTSGVSMINTVDIKTNKELVAALLDNGIDIKATEPKVEEPKVEEPKVEEPIVEEPQVEEPVVVEPIVEEPKVEEPKIEEPKVEEPKVEEPITEELVLPAEYKRIEESARIESKYSLNEIFKLNQELATLRPPAEPADLEVLTEREKRNFYRQQDKYEDRVEGIQKAIADENRRTKFIYEQRFAAFAKNVSDQAKLNEFRNWLTNDGVGRTRVYSSAMGDESIEEVYDEFLRKKQKKTQRKVDNSEVQKLIPSKFKAEKSKPVQPVAKKTTVNAKFPRMSDPRNSNRVERLKILWDEVRPGQKITDEAIEKSLEAGDKVIDGRF